MVKLRNVWVPEVLKRSGGLPKRRVVVRSVEEVQEPGCGGVPWTSKVHYQIVPDIHNHTAFSVLLLKIIISQYRLGLHDGPQSV
jgi:hypothetical protein